ncbi:MAG: hypothetical protein M0R46_09395 [Candidatus Muirbacterium halophilum]|nr:hypothetical protein [Candidatus Muirbacterium halophilum]MCK9476122.1 hypothetical protein [Candidatus Muirbacterium halophilum]
MNDKLRFAVIILLCCSMFPMFFMMKDYNLIDLTSQTKAIIRQAQKYNIGNTVTFVYLGERVTDTVFETLIVIVTALSMEYLRKRR